MKQTAEFFQDRNPVLVFIAKRLRDALRLEKVLNEAGMDYGVEADQYRGGVVFRTVRTGAFFYVLPEAVEATFAVMERNGFVPHREAHDEV